MKTNALDPEDLGTFDPLWRGWKLRRGMLYDPMNNSTLGWTPSQIRAGTYWRLQARALEIELDRTRTQLHDLETLIGQHGPRDTAEILQRRAKAAAKMASQGATAPRTKPPRRTPPAAHPSDGHGLPATP